MGANRVNWFKSFRKTSYFVSEYLETLMPNHKSAEKRVRQSERRRKLNRGNRSRLRTSLKNLRSALEGDGKQASEILPETISTIDRAVQKGVLHKNAAARYKSRLTARVNAAAAK
jgi:small subunit ribosomal protein S20